ncbi:tetratricopeptide repeat protein [Candidatus Methanoplasma termitum]|nr:hypothetical protein [Candidatus Methanoplasma termitum]
MSEIKKIGDAFSKALANNPIDSTLNRSMGICFTYLGLYEKACACFEKVIDINPEGSFGYYAMAICLLKGKPAFLCEKKTIDKSIEYLNAAIMIEDFGIFQYLMAYIKYDYYSRKFLNIKPDYQHHLDRAHSIGISKEDVYSIFDLLKVEMPDCFEDRAGFASNK